MAVVLFARRGVVDVLLMILAGAALMGMYLRRRCAAPKQRLIEATGPPDAQRGKPCRSGGYAM
jgi:hypothetical protein